MLNWIICPTCQGEGVSDNRICRTCVGRGAYSWFGGYLLFVGRVLAQKEIIADRFKKIFRIILCLLLTLFGLLGLACLAQIILLAQGLNQWNYLPWTRETLLLIFWISVLADLYFFYYVEQTREKRQKVWPKSARTITQLPSSWVEAHHLSKNVKIDIIDSFSQSAKVLMQKAWQLAHRLKHQKIELIHLFAASLQVSDVSLAINRLGLDWSKLQGKITRILAKISSQKLPGEIYYALETKKALLQAYGLAGQKKRSALGPLEILESLVSFEGPAKEILYDLEVGLNEIKNVCLWIDVYEDLRHAQRRFAGQARLKPKGAINRAYTAVATPYLDAYSQDVTQLARNGYLGFCMDREKETSEIFRIFEGGRQSVILVGPPGVGKTTIINGIARQMVAEEIPEFLQDKRLVSLSIPRLIAGASQPGEIEKRIQIIMNEIIRSGNIVLFIKDIHNMVGIRTTEGEMDVSEILASVLKNKLFLVLATSISDEYKRLIEGKALAEVLQKVDISEPDKNTTIQILEAKAAPIESREQVYFSYGALNKTVDLSTRYLHERYLPEKAINLLKEVAVLVKNKRGPRTIIQAEDVAELVADKTNIPVSKITEKESKKLLNLEEQIHQRLIDQDEAVNMVAAALRRARTELRSAKRPIVNLLFLGPTGVGKTELAKTVAEVYFGDENKMIRLDMSEYQEKASISRLLGAPGGGKGGQLTDAVRENPFSLLLLDEIEKAHPDILNVFLQVMDDGRLTDARGRTVNFTNIILISTSNAGTTFIQDEIQKGTALATIHESLIRKELKSYFRPEFLNRFDGVVVFKPLGREEIKQITKLMLNKLAVRLKEKGITLKPTDEAIAELAEAGFDPTFGARPLQRVIQTRVNDALAKFLLTGKLSRRDAVILEKGGVVRVEKGKSI